MALAMIAGGLAAATLQGPAWSRLPLEGSAAEGTQAEGAPQGSLAAAGMGAQGRDWMRAAYFEPMADGGYLVRGASIPAWLEGGRLHLGEVVLTLGADGAHAVAGAPMPSVSHYITGDAPAAWRVGVAHYRELRLPGAEPGVEVAVYSTPDGELEWDFVLAPGADAGAVAFSVAGHDGLALLDDGSLEVKVGEESFAIAAPVAYQDDGARRRPVESAYELAAQEGSGARAGSAPAGAAVVRIRVTGHDPSLPLTIDPRIGWGSYLGSGSMDMITSVEVSPDPNEPDVVFVAGSTYSSASPAFKKPSPAVATYDLTPNGGYFDGFIAKVDTSKTGLAALLWMTYLGSSSTDYIHDIAVGDAGIFVGGSLHYYCCTNPGAGGFPTTATAAKPAITNANDQEEGFLAQLSLDGTQLLYSTFVGGSYSYSTCQQGACVNTGLSYIGDRVVGVDLAPDGTVVLAGYTAHSPVAANEMAAVSAFQTLHGSIDPGFLDAFVARYDTTQAGVAGILYQTFLGGRGHDWATAVRVDGAGTAWVVGATIAYGGNGNNAPKGFPTQAGAFQPIPTGPTTYSDAFVVAVPPNGGVGLAELPFSTLLGGYYAEEAYGVAVGNGAVYVSGYTYSPYEPEFTKALPGATVVQPCMGIYFGQYCSNYSYYTDAFVVRLDPMATGAGQVSAGTYLGSYFGSESAWDVEVDGDGKVHVFGGAYYVAYQAPGSMGSYYLTETANVQSQGSKGYADLFAVKLNADLSGSAAYKPLHTVLVGGTGIDGMPTMMYSYYIASYYPWGCCSGLYNQNQYQYGPFTGLHGAHPGAILPGGDPVVGTTGSSGGVPWMSMGIQTASAGSSDGMLARITKSPPYFPSQCRVNGLTSSVAFPVTVQRASSMTLSLPTVSVSGVSYTGAVPTDAPLDPTSYTWYLDWSDPASLDASGNGLTAWTKYVPPTYTPGPHTVHVTVKDDTGKAPDEGSTDCWINVVNKAPIPVITGPASAALGATVTLDSLLGQATGTRDDDGAITKLQWNANDLSGMSCKDPATNTASFQGAKLACTFTTGGTRTFTLTATDNDGASCASNYPLWGATACTTTPTQHTVTVTVPTAQAPTAGFTSSMADPAGGTAPLAPSAFYTCGDWAAVQLVSTASAAAGKTLVGWSWDVTGDGKADLSGPTASYAFPGAGSYPVALTVTDSAGLTAKATANLVVAQQPVPLAAIGQPTGLGSPYPAGAEAVFADQSAFPGAAMASRAWTVDGQDAGAGAELRRVLDPGTHKVALTVRDAKGCSATDAVTVAVQSVPAPPPSNVAAVAAPSAPQAAFTMSTNTPAVDDVVRFEDLSVPGAAPIAAASWAFGDGAVADTTGRPTHRYSDPGEYTVRLTVRDLAGLESVATQTVKVLTARERELAGRAPVAADAGAEAVARGGELVQLDGTRSSGAGLVFQWEQVEGPPVPLQGAATVRPTFVAPVLPPDAVEATLLFRLVVSDGTQASHPDQVRVRLLPPEGLSFRWQADGVAMAVEAAGASGRNVTWDFGDGAVAYGQQASHLYARPGTYEVTMTVDAGQPQSTRQAMLVEVLPDAPARASRAGSDGGATVLGMHLGTAVAVFAVTAMAVGGTLLALVRRR